MKKLLFAAVAVVILLVFAYFHVRTLMVRDIPSLRVEIPAGSGARAIAHALRSQNVIGSEAIFVLKVKTGRFDRKLKPGSYRFTGRMTMDAVIAKIVKGENELIKVTIPEGLTIEETAAIVQRCGVGNRDLFLKLARDSVFASELVREPVPDLEGYLYPETYMMPENLKEETILRVMVGQFHKEMDRFLNQRGGLSPREALTLASIVESEAKVGEEKPLIAAVYLNRLHRKQRLEADPTVCYAWAQKGVEKKRLLFVDLEIQSPYNTYRTIGLPPGPICSPAASTLDAVRHPANVNYLFFHTVGDSGRHMFTRTLAEHDASLGRH
jgi:UPF0755 protein